MATVDRAREGDEEGTPHEELDGRQATAHEGGAQERKRTEVAPLGNGAQR